MEEIWGLVKDNIIFNVIVLNSDNPELLNNLKNIHNADYIIRESELNLRPSIGYIYDSTLHILTMPQNEEFTDETNTELEGEIPQIEN